MSLFYFSIIFVEEVKSMKKLLLIIFLQNISCFLIAQNDQEDSIFIPPLENFANFLTDMEKVKNGALDLYQQNIQTIPLKIQKQNISFRPILSFLRNKHPLHDERERVLASLPKVDKSTQINNMGNIINSSYNDYAPVVSADNSVLIFTSRRKHKKSKKSLDDNQYYEDIYISYKEVNGWTSPEKLHIPHKPKFHEASIALSADGQELFIYIDKRRGDIYLSKMHEDNTWTKPRSLGKNINSKHRELSISMSMDKQTIYFSSDRPGGYGGLDIYKSQRQADGTWGIAQNLGPTINTKYDEDAPFIHVDNKTLYFSSRGHQTLGRYDIFVTSLNANHEWLTPRNVGLPINTAEDDIHFVISADYKQAYLASKREDSIGEQDIYNITIPNKITDTIEENPEERIAFELLMQVVPVNFMPLVKENSGKSVAVFTGNITSKESHKLLNAKVSLIDVVNNKLLKKFNSVSVEGSHAVLIESEGKYLVVVQKEGYMFESEYLELEKKDSTQTYKLDIRLEKIAVGSKLFLNTFFDYNSSNLKKESIPSLEHLTEFLQLNPQVIVEVSGHTDNIGNAQKNKLLSEDRAKSVSDYLILRGIDEARIEYKGYGSERPIATNTTPEGRKKNRRTECRIVEIN